MMHEPGFIARSALWQFKGLRTHDKPTNLDSKRFWPSYTAFVFQQNVKIEYFSLGRPLIAVDAF